MGIGSKDGSYEEFKFELDVEVVGGDWEKMRELDRVRVMNDSFSSRLVLRAKER